MLKPQQRRRARGDRARTAGLALLLAALLPHTAHAQSLPLKPQPQAPATSAYPARVLDRPTTLPRGDSRLDAFAFATRAIGNPTSATIVFGGGVGITDQFEIGGQLVPFDVESGIVFTNPSVYATYQFPINKATTVAPTIQAVYPLTSDDPFIVDVGGTIYVNIGTWGYLAFAPTFSLNTRGDESGSSLSFPLTVMRQGSEQLSFQLSSGVGFSRFDPRFGLSRRRDELDFNEATIPATALVTYTVARGPSRTALADLTLQFQWPQLYTRASGVRGTHTNDWTVQVQTSLYFIH
jgi:hypothetical protein